MKMFLFFLFNVFFLSFCSQERVEFNDVEVDVDVCYGYQPNPDSLGVYFFVENMPLFPDCELGARSENRFCTISKIRSFVLENLHYPQIMIDQQEQGKVWVYYEIGKEGRVQNVKVLKGVSPLFDQE